MCGWVAWQGLIERVWAKKERVGKKELCWEGELGLEW